MKEFCKNYKEIIKLVLCFLLFYFTGTIITIPFKLLNIDYSLNNNPSLYYILTLAVNVLRAILLILLYRKDLKRDFKNLKGNFWEFSDIAVKYWIIGLAIMAVSNILISLLTPAKMAVNEEGVRTMIKASPIIMLILTTITAPISEEILFRKSFKNVIKDKTLYILVSGLVFGALHVVTSYNTLYDLLYLIPYSALGISFAITCSKTDNVYPSMIIHAIHNGAITLVTVIGTLAGIIL